MEGLKSIALMEQNLFFVFLYLQDLNHIDYVLSAQQAKIFSIIGSLLHVYSKFTGLLPILGKCPLLNPCP